MRLIKTISQQELDGIYDYFCNTLYSEMDQYLKIRNKCPQSKKKQVKFSKPY